METNNKLGQESAFPWDYKIVEHSKGEYNPFGMSKRFYAACAAMQGLLSNPNIGHDVFSQEVAEQAYKMADALLKQENE